MGFPDNRMDTVALLDIVQALEIVIDEVLPSVVYTHHAGDLNVDHGITHRAVMTACRPQPSCCVKEIYSFEILSSTAWLGHSTADMFKPNCFVDIRHQIDIKLGALLAYKGEVRDFPHSRSIEGVKALVSYRGVSAGFEAAEAFYIERILKG